MKHIHFYISSRNIACLLLFLISWSLGVFGQDIKRFTKASQDTSPPIFPSITSIIVNKPGTLHECLTKAQQDTCQHLVVSGKLNSADIKVLRRMAGADGHGSLHILDLKDVTIASSEEPYLTIQRAEEEMFPYITVDVGSMNGSVGHRSTDELGHPLVEIYYSNFILPWDASKKPNAQEISETLLRWKMLKKQKLRTKGHNISQDKNGHFVYSAFTSKNLFCRDMFFRCPNLRLIILPDKRKSYDQVFVLDDPIRYMEATKELRFK